MFSATQCLPLLVASIVFHESFLRSALSANHPLFFCELFASGIIQILRGRAITGVFKCPHTGLLASGIPTFLVTAVRLDQLIGDFNSFKGELKELLSSSQGSLQGALEKTPEQVVEVLRKHFMIEGVVPVSRSDFADFAKLLESAIEARFERLRETFENSRQLAESPTPAPADSTHPPADAFKMWTWGGRIHMVPEGFVLPRPPLKTFFMLWHHGNIDTSIRPLKHLCKFDVTPADWVQVSRARGCWHRVVDRMEQRSRCGADAPIQRMAPLAMDWGRQLRLRYVPHQSWILSNRFLAPGDDAGSLEAIRNRNFVEGGRSGLHSGPDHHLSLPSDPRGSLVGDVVHEMLLEAPIHSSVQRLQNM